MCRKQILDGGIQQQIFCLALVLGKINILGFKPTLSGFSAFCNVLQHRSFHCSEINSVYELENAHNFGVGCHVIVLSS